MAISDFPAALQPIIQQGFLEQQFHQALRSRLGYRMIADREDVPNRIGETITKTRIGLLPAAVTPINVAAIPPLGGTGSKLDSGLTPQTQNIEQYTLTMNKYGMTLDVDIHGERVGVANLVVQNSYSLGENAGRTLDELARNQLYSAYQGGNTFVRTSSTTAVVPVDDVRGFLTSTAQTSGVPNAVSSANRLNVVINGNPYQVIGVSVDGTNASLTFGGSSGSLTLSAAVSSADGTAGNAVVSVVAPLVLRPNARATYGALVAGDQLNMAQIEAAVATLRSNGVPPVAGLYNAYVDPVSTQQLFQDPDFKQLFQGATYESSAYAAGAIERPFLGVRFMPTTEAPVQSHPTLNLRIHRPIICGMGALVEGDFAGALQDEPGAPKIVEESVVDGVRMVTRPPVDRLGDLLSQSWTWSGGFCAPTDLTTTSATIPTATSSAYKRAVIIEHIGA